MNYDICIRYKSIQDQGVNWMKFIEAAIIFGYFTYLCYRYIEKIQRYFHFTKPST